MSLVQCMTSNFTIDTYNRGWKLRVSCTSLCPRNVIVPLCFNQSRSMLMSNSSEYHHTVVYWNSPLSITSSFKHYAVYTGDRGSRLLVQYWCCTLKQSSDHGSTVQEFELAGERERLEDENKCIVDIVVTCTDVVPWNEAPTTDRLFKNSNSLAKGSVWRMRTSVLLILSSSIHQHNRTTYSRRLFILPAPLMSDTMYNHSGRFQDEMTKWRSRDEMDYTSIFIPAVCCPHRVFESWLHCLVAGKGRRMFKIKHTSLYCLSKPCRQKTCQRWQQ